MCMCVCVCFQQQKLFLVYNRTHTYTYIYTIFIYIYMYVCVYVSFGIVRHYANHFTLMAIDDGFCSSGIMATRTLTLCMRAWILA